MSLETALRARIKASAAVQAIGASVEWANRKGFPAIVLQVVSRSRVQHMKGFQRLIGARVQADVMALDAPTKVALREAYIAAIAGPEIFGGVSFDRVADLFDRDMSEQIETEFVHRDVVDAVIWYLAE